jgi:Predicted glutamine amidotransferase
MSRIKARGIDVSVEYLKAGESADMNSIDIFFAGGGQDFQQEILMEDFKNGRAEDIRSAVEDEKVFLAICGGYQMLGQYFKTHDGHQLDFVGALNIHTIGQNSRMVGDYMFKCSDDSSGSVVVGFENHSGKTYLGEGVSPLGTVLRGFGNNGEDGTAGARYKNVFCSYSHGPILPKNPVLADFIILTALKRKYPDAVLQPIDDRYEHKAHDFMVKRLTQK